jgi:hypothetical protein
MKKILCTVAALVAFAAFAQVPSYAPSTISIGTSTIGTNTGIALPITTGTNTSITYDWSWISATVTNIATNTFTRPTTNTVYTTNVFIGSNNIYGLTTNSWYQNQPIYVTNTVAWTNTYGTNNTLTYDYRNYTTGIPFTAVGTNSTTNTTYTYGAYTIDARNSASVALEAAFKLGSAGTANLVITLWQSIDGTNAATTGRKDISFAATGATLTRQITNLTIGPPGFYIIAGITNANTDAAVNSLVLRSVSKISAP